MKYAIWKLDFTDSSYGTGPEHLIAQLGYKAEGAWVDGEVENGGTILGYVFGEPDASKLSKWNFSYITKDEALSFCQSLLSDAHFLDNGIIAFPIIESTDA